MEKIIAACGNDCAACPRHLPRTEEELHHTAELWHRIGYRDRVVSNEEIACSGCKPGNWCRYGIIDCVTERGLRNCGECGEYPCARAEECFRVTRSFYPACAAACSPGELEALERAFFEKEKNLEKA